MWTTKAIRLNQNVKVGCQIPKSLSFVPIKANPHLRHIAFIVTLLRRVTCPGLGLKASSDLVYVELKQSGITRNLNSL